LIKSDSLHFQQGNNSEPYSVLCVAAGMKNTSDLTSVPIKNAVILHFEISLMIKL